MKITPSNLLQVTLLCFVLFLNFSCNKDSDLLAEYVVEENTMGTEPNEVILDLANAVFTTEEDQAVSFNMLYNTSSNSKGRRRYKRSSKPKYGTITIEKDSVALYTPSNDYNGKDEIEITLEVTNEDETTSDVIVTVDVTVEPVADVVVDTIVAPLDEPIVIEPLKNDTFKKESKVVITEVSKPSNGTAVVNEDNTITYTPNSKNSEDEVVEEVITEEVLVEEVIAEEDTFTYTTSVTNLDNTISTETGKITVTVEQETIIPVEINDKIAYFKELFDKQTKDDERQLALSKSGDGGDIYYLDVSPYVYMFQITGEYSYMNFAIELFQNVIGTASDATITGDGFLGWKDSSTDVTNGVGVNNGTEVALAESRGMRTIATMLWVLAKSPSYRASGNNELVYNELLSWFETHIWSKWESRGIGNILRSNTHMSSHWGIYVGWSSGMTIGTYKGHSMRRQLREVALKDGPGYVWNASWGSMSGSNDVSHANAEVELMILGAEMNDIWSKTDIEKLIRTFDENIYKGDSWENSATYIAGNGTSPALWDQGWIQLGRFSETLQSKLEKTELLPAYYYSQKARIANLAYNRAYLDNKIFYPEN